MARKWIPSIIFGIVALAIFEMVSATPVFAQDPEPTQTPTPTIVPTPAWQESVQLSSGSEMIIERRFSYGEIAIVIAVLLVGVEFFAYASVRIIKLWL